MPPWRPVEPSGQDSSEGGPVKLTLSPVAAPSPALKYLLLPELMDQTPGNAALEYYRAFSPEWWGNIRQQKTWETIDSAQHTPLRNFPRKDVGWLQNNRMLEQVELAARREYVDWGMTERIRRDGFELLLPDVQSLRQIATLLAVRARLEIADGRYDKAVYTLQTGLALARHIGDGVLLIQDLVGMAVAGQMFAQVEELIQRPGAPNLYWALTELPRPFFDIRKALQGEKVGMYASIPELRTLETTPLTLEQQQRLVQILGGGADALFYGKRPNWNNRLAGMFLTLHAYPEAKQALIAAGRKPEEVEALPTLQVELIRSLHQYKRLQDDVYKCASLPYWEAKPRMEQVDKHFRQARGRLEGMPLRLPAGANFDRQGKPLLSWRVHLLPFDAAFKGGAARPRMPADFPDGTSNTILIVEADDAHAVPWTKPEDLKFDADHPNRGLGGHFCDGFLVGLADGSVYLVGRAVSKTTLQRAFNPADGQVLGPDW
jgi:hypothetical protein